MPKKYPRLYLGRQAEKAFGREWYGMGRKKTEWDKEYGFSKASFIDQWCASLFESITGIKLKPGEVRKIKSIKIELED